MVVGDSQRHRVAARQREAVRHGRPAAGITVTEVPRPGDDGAVGVTRGIGEAELDGGVALCGRDGEAGVRQPVAHFDQQVAGGNRIQVVGHLERDVVEAGAVEKMVERDLG